MATINPSAAATQATEAASQLSHAAQKSSSSALSSLKDLFREAHPFARKPAYLQSHPVYWKFYATKFGRASLFYFPGMLLVLGWPWAAKWLINSANGVYDTPAKKVGRK